jgi:hypothetical protein
LVRSATLSSSFFTITGGKSPNGANCARKHHRYNSVMDAGHCPGVFIRKAKAEAHFIEKNICIVANIAAAGSGYAINDLITLAGGTSTVPVRILVTNVVPIRRNTLPLLLPPARMP